MAYLAFLVLATATADALADLGLMGEEGILLVDLERERPERRMEREAERKRLTMRPFLTGEVGIGGTGI